MGLLNMILQTNVLAAFAPERFVQKRIAATDAFEVQLVCLDTGQFFPVHVPQSDTVMILWEGQADLIMGDQTSSIATGYIVTIPRGVRRGFKARSKTIAFMIHCPPLTEREKEEIERQIEEGEFPL